MKIQVQIIRIHVKRHGDPKHEKYGEIYYTFKVNGNNLAGRTRDNHIKSKDNSFIDIRKQRTIDVNPTGTFSISGFVADKDAGLNGKDERDDFNLIIDASQNWKAGNNQLHLLDGNLSVVVHYKITLVDSNPSGTNTAKVSTPNKIASVVIVSMIDNDFYKLFQNANNNYGACFEGYNRTVLFKKQFAGSPKPTEHIRNITTSEILKKLTDLADDGYAIDMWIFSHGTHNKITMDDNVNITAANIKSLVGPSKNYSAGKFPLRMVYQMNCYGYSLNNAFRHIGTKSVCGSRFVNFYPNQCNNFTKRWNDGETFKNAVKNSDTASSRTVIQAAIIGMGQFASYSPRCLIPQMVLNKTNCAAAYFRKRWFVKPKEYDTNKSGKQNMNYSSFMMISEKIPNLRKTSRPSW